MKVNGNIFDVFENRLSNLKASDHQGILNAYMDDGDFIEDKEGMIRLNQAAKAAEPKRTLMKAYDLLYRTHLITQKRMNRVGNRSCAKRTGKRGTSTTSSPLRSTSRGT